MKNKKGLFSIDKLRNNKLRKRFGDDKLIVGLVLVVVGIVLCMVYKTSIVDTVKDAITALTAKITNLMAEPSTGGTTLKDIIYLGSLIK